MRKILFFVTISLLFIACQDGQRTEGEVVSLFTDIQPITPAPPDTATLNERLRKIGREVDYYLQRHTVEDEGYDMVVRYSEQHDALLADYMPKEQPTLLSLFDWRNHPRHGTGMKVTDDYLYIANWRADTMSSGLRIGRDGVYAGKFDRYQRASGHGCYSGYDGSYYEGHWQDDRQHGFGLGVTTRNLQAGIWKRGRFFGEHMQHTNDRIYGIDISRYQHERGRRRMGIDWRDLRITSLGRRIKGNIAGEVDYPVRFVYIKSTQGISIRNRYLMTDYAAARRRGLPVGVYHFYSTRQSAKAQASYFLNHSLFKRGDLPPVLDIEPSDGQIAKMGGKEVLLQEIRTWVRIVEQRLKVRPILYVNQKFVNTYLVDAPDLIENYLIWIARYGEYKPGVHLALWQVSADSRVKGIQTEVDVNVFNGYEQHWEEFLNNETIQ